MTKLLEDAKAAGLLDIVDDEFLVRNDFVNILAKFAALQIHDGYKLMPIKLTDKMRWSASLEMPLHHGRLDKMYDAMIASSPSINFSTSSQSWPFKASDRKNLSRSIGSGSDKSISSALYFSSAVSGNVFIISPLC